MKTSYWNTWLASSVFGWFRWLALACLLSGAASSALAAKTYTDNGDGTVTDTTTGLQWMRCAVGQTWSGSTCTGTASTYNWAQANALTGTVTYAGQSDWRLPNIRELQTIVDPARYNPAIDTAAFPNTPASYFWSASGVANYPDFARYVYFYYGYAGYYSKNNTYPVRLVRAGQSLGLLDVARPSTDYIDQGNGTVTHTPTSLVWQRCAVGQTWTGSTCSGTASTFTGDAAKVLTSTFAGQTDWRVPTEEELLSLVDYSRYSPAINPTLFPNTSASYFWSASADAYSFSYAWSVRFDDGSAWNSDKSHAYQVRFVRAGQSFDSFALTVAKTGSGAVTSSPAGIDCGTTCSANFNSGTIVTLTATPAAGNTFGGWSGACTGTGSCIVAMSTNQSVTATFNAIIPAVSLTPVSLSFVPQGVGTTSAAKTVTVTNTSGAVVNIASIVANGDFARTTTCGATLAPSASCTIDVTFGPTTAGTYLSSLVITSNAASSPNTVSLSGTGTVASTSPVCSLSASPSSIFAGGSSTLTATCSPVATSYVWTGGTCAGTATGTCTVTPATTTSYTVQGSNAGGNSNIASAGVSVVATPPVFAAGLYDGIYQWSSGHYLSIHQHGSRIIATIYFNADGSFTFPSSDGHVLAVPQLDIFDLLNGPITGNIAKITGTRFHRACNESHDFVFDDNGNITVTKTGVSNAAAADLAGISCAAITDPVGTVLIVPKILF